MRKLIICLDGTGNAVGSCETNVLKLYKALNETDDQLTHYVMGVGTNDGQRLFGVFRQKIRGVMGLAFGLGLEDDVLEAYRFLCRSYRDREAAEDAGQTGADQIYIFGFSRGAYAARVLAGFIHNFGLVAPSKLHLVPPAFRAYRRVTDADKDAPAGEVFQALREFEMVLRPNDSVPIRALGLFDTVSSILRFWPPHRNLWRYQSPIALGTHASVNHNPSVRIILHALAVDERRSLFRPQFWKPRTETFADGTVSPAYFGNRFRTRSAMRKQYVQQRWFPGYHSDIGGSPPEDEAGIGKLTLKWMLKALEDAEVEAEAEDRAVLKARKQKLPKARTRKQAKLAFRRGHVGWYLEGTDENKKTPGGLPYSVPDALAKIHDSIWGNRRPQLIWLWNIFEVLPKTLKRRGEGRPAWWRRGLIWYFPLYEPRHIPDDHDKDPSIQDRKSRFSHYRPPNLP